MTERVLARPIGLMAVSAIALILTGGNQRPPLLAAALVVGGLIAWWPGARIALIPEGRGLKLAGTLAVVAALGLTGPMLGAHPSSIEWLRPILMALVGIVAVVCHLWGGKAWAIRLVVAASVIGLVLTSAVLVTTEWGSDLGSDVYHAHVAAGRALYAGENPYTDAVAFLSGNPHHPPGTVIYGYGYPPVVLMTYGLAGGFTDPRLVTMLAMLVVIAGMAWLTLRSRSPDSAGLAASGLVLLAFTPLNSEVWFMAWTEPLTLALLFGAALAWKRSWLWSGVLFGLALASKQYMIFLAPLLLFHRDEGWQRRSVMAIATASATLLAGMVPDPQAFISATIGNLVGIGFRPDTQSLPGALNALGLEVVLPTWLWLAVSMVAAVLIARGSMTIQGMLARAALILGAVFFLGLAFPNYWYVVGGLMAVAISFSDHEVAEPPQLSSGSAP